jgi:hypothetical protein
MRDMFPREHICIFYGGNFAQVFHVEHNVMAEVY